MRRLLIISPYFPPCNAADMQRVRMSLVYFKELGWEAEVVTVSAKHADINKDDLLLQSIPTDIPIHEVEALPKRYTSKFGLGSIALRSLFHFYRKVNRLLSKKRFDLVYFSTTQYPVCVLGGFWKQKFGVPYVIDMQDPWHSDYYEDKPKHERPPKYWLAYNLNRVLEPLAMKSADGIISVSEAYIAELRRRYPNLRSVPAKTITFGAFEKDKEIAIQNHSLATPAIEKNEQEYSIVYIGRGGNDMHKSVSIFFNAFRTGLRSSPELFKRFKMYFIGTSYAAEGQGKKTILPIAAKFGLDNYVIEQTDRVAFYRALTTLNAADVLFVPGSDDPQYTASKIYPYLLAERPLISIFHPASSAARIIKKCKVGLSLTFDMDEQESYKLIVSYIESAASQGFPGKKPRKEVFGQYTARSMAQLQVELFNKVLLVREGKG